MLIEAVVCAPTMTRLPDGTQLWFRHGVAHRDDGPAAVWADGSMAWKVNGLLHREDGPAVIRFDGAVRWYLFGARLSSSEAADWQAARAS